MVRMMGLEPIRSYHTPLKRTRLPIPPHPHYHYIVVISMAFVNLLFALDKKITKPHAPLYVAKEENP